MLIGRCNVTEAILRVIRAWKIAMVSIGSIHCYVYPNAALRSLLFNSSLSDDQTCDNIVLSSSQHDLAARCCEKAAAVSNEGQTGQHSDRIGQEPK